MTQSIDQRIVDMRFNNKQFAEGVKSSIKDLSSLKKSLDLKNAGKGLASLQSAGRRFDLSGITKGIESISSRFSAMGAIGFTVIQNLTNQVIKLGKKMSDSFIKPLNEGFGEYELKMNSIQTIMTNVKDKGTSLAEVNAVLDDLNGYADKTIYNFAQMTDNLGKFTTAGIGAAEAATTIKGIGNVAAGFGVSAQKMAGATYQISQALQSGYFRLQDWMSLETAGMGGTMLQTALKKSAKELGIFVDETVPFRYSLEQAWLTSEVFTNAMADMAEDKNLLAAAQNVTTFTKLIGVMAEVRASGWASTWEQIAGNKDQSTRLWTGVANAFGEVVGASDAARTAVFKFWNDKGGRKEFLTGIANILFIFADILEPIEQAAAGVFEALSGEKLVAFSVAFRKLTENFKIGEETTDLLKRTFTGLFSIMSIGKKIILTLVKSVFVVIKAFTSLSSGSNGFLKMTASLGDFLQYIDKTVFSSENLAGALGKLGSVMAPVAKTIKTAFTLLGGGIGYLASQIDTVAIGAFFIKVRDQLAPVFAQLKEDFIWLGGKVNFDSIKKELRELKDRFTGFIGGMNIGSALENLGSGIKTTIDKIKNFFTPLTKGGSVLLAIFKKVGGAISKVFGAISGFIVGIVNAMTGAGGELEGGQGGGLGEVLSNMWEAIDFEMIEKLLKGSLLASIVLVLRKFINGISGITGGASKLFESIVETLDSVQDTLEAYQKSIKATILIKIAAAIAILALSLIALSLVDPKKLAIGLGVMAALMAEVLGAMKIFNKYIDEDDKDLAKLAVGFLALGAALLLLSASLYLIGKLSLKDASQGVAGVASLVAILVGVSKYMKTNVAGLAKLSAQFVLLAVALTAMVVPIALMGMMSLEQISKGILGISAVLAGLVVFLKVMESVNGSAASAKTLVVVAGALLIISAAMFVFGRMSWDEIGKGLASMGGALLLLAGTMKVLKPTDIASAQALFIIASAMLVIGFVLRDLGNMEWEVVGKGLLFMAGALLVLAGAMKIIKPTDIGSAGALLVLVGAMLLMGTVLKDLGTMEWETIGKGLLAMAASLAVLVIATNAMNGAVTGAGSMVVVALALMLMVPSIIALSQLPIAGVGVAILALAGVFAVLGAAAYFIGPLTPIVVALAGSVTLLGLGVFLTGVGVAALAVGLAALAGALYANGVAFTLFIEDIIPLIPMFMKKLGEGIVEFIKQINRAIPELAKTVVAIFDGIVYVIEKAGIVLIDAVVQFILDILMTIDKYLPKFIEVGSNILINLLNGMSDNIEKITDVVSDIITKFINSLEKKQKPFLEAGANFIISFINNLADTIRDTKFVELMGDAIINLMTGILGYTPADFYEAIDKFKEIGTWLIEGLKDGILSLKKKAVDGVNDVATSIVDGVKGIFDINSPSEVFRKIGKNIMDSLTDSVKDNGEGPVDATTDVSKNMVSAAKKGTTGVAKENKKVADSSAKAIKSAYDKAVEAIEDRKYYNKLSLQEELEAWQAIQADYNEGTDERKKADREVYRVKNELVAASYAHSISWIEKEKYYNRLSLTEELAAYDRILAREETTKEERLKIAREIYRVKAEIAEEEEQLNKDAFDNSVKWINKEKKYKRLTLRDEYDAWKRVQVRYAEGTEERTQAETEMERVRDEINQGTLDFYDAVVAANEEANDKRAALDKEYYDKEKELNEKRKQDIKSVSDAYDAALKSRSSSLYGSYGLFDEVEIIDPEMLMVRRDALNKEIKSIELIQAKYAAGSQERKEADERATKAKQALDEVETELLTGDELLKNLNSQVQAFESWQLDIRALAKKGIDDGLIKELEAMGPKSSKQIKALLMLSEQELEKYVFLWTVKHQTAKNQAVDELQELKEETVYKIGEIKTESSVALNEYTKMWTGKMETINSESDKKLAELKSKWKSRLGEVRESSENEIIVLTKNIQEIIKKPDWSAVGTGMLKEILVGISNGTAALAEGAKIAAKKALAAMSSVLKDNESEKASVLAGAISVKLAEPPIRYGPIIKPVVDLSNVRRADAELTRVFGPQQLVDPTSNNFRLGNEQATGATNVKNEFNISQLVVREEADVPKVARELENMQVTRGRS